MLLDVISMLHPTILLIRGLIMYSYSMFFPRFGLLAVQGSRRVHETYSFQNRLTLKEALADEATTSGFACLRADPRFSLPNAKGQTFHAPAILKVMQLDLAYFTTPQCS